MSIMGKLRGETEPARRGRGHTGDPRRRSVGRGRTVRGKEAPAGRRFGLRLRRRPAPPPRGMRGFLNRLTRHR